MSDVSHPLPSVFLICGWTHIKVFVSEFSLHFVGVTSCLKGTKGGQSNIPSTLEANGWANMNNTLCSCVCVSVHLGELESLSSTSASLSPSQRPSLCGPSGHIRWWRAELLESWLFLSSSLYHLYCLLHPLAPLSWSSQMFPLCSKQLKRHFLSYNDRNLLTCCKRRRKNAASCNRFLLPVLQSDHQDVQRLFRNKNNMI